MDHYFSILDTGIAAVSIIIPLKTPQTRTHAQIWTSTFLTLSEKCQLKLTVVSASFYVFRIWLHYIPCCTSLSVYPGIHLLNRFIHGWISSKAGIQTQNRFWIQTHKHTHTHTVSVTGARGVLSCVYSHWSHSHWELKDKHRLLLVLCICISIYYVSVFTHIKSFQFLLCLMQRFHLLPNTWAPRIRGLRS